MLTNGTDIALAVAFSLLGLGALVGLAALLIFARGVASRWPVKPDDALLRRVEERLTRLEEQLTQLRELSPSVERMQTELATLGSMVLQARPRPPPSTARTARAHARTGHTDVEHGEAIPDATRDGNDTTPMTMVAFIRGMMAAEEDEASNPAPVPAAPRERSR